MFIAAFAFAGMFSFVPAAHAEFNPAVETRYDASGNPVDGVEFFKLHQGNPTGISYSPIQRETVEYHGPYGKGTIVINTAERRLYLVQGDGTALKYGIGVGRPGFQWAGVHYVTNKAEWPGWTPPPEMRRRVPNLPGYMPGGPENPLGARAMYIGSTYYRIHGSNEPWTIGQAVSSGCFRMTNDDVTDLYERVHVGAKVIVVN
ncbi:MAG: L,D-transpeptidase [Ancalomicrobiaceae bacterium]|nr:L,D-transpeptidase [Ancalomicrobiaceae bacterium]